MELKTNELTGTALDWAVAKCEGIDSAVCGGVVWKGTKYSFNPSTNWAQGGPIIEREAIHLCGGAAQTYDSSKLPEDPWSEYFYVARGVTILEAAMRCYVASKLGDEIDIPEELI